ncbi:MAG: hypothetical protein PWQ96_162 [Clostridia bacterium]|jgi:hypothetical protein|nr:hypothetical protein [Clostridia bacterium]
MVKKYIVLILFVIVFVSIFLWWQQYQEHKSLMKHLALHQPIEINEIESVHSWVKLREKKEVSKQDVERIVRWFNTFPAESIREKGDFYDNPTHQAGIIIILNSGYEVAIYYVEGMVDVSRTDVKNGMEISYHFLEDAPELDNYFIELFKQRSS